MYDIAYMVNTGASAFSLFLYVLIFTRGSRKTFFSHTYTTAALTPLYYQCNIRIHMARPRFDFIIFISKRRYIGVYIIILCDRQYVIVAVVRRKTRQNVGHTRACRIKGSCGLFLL